MCNYIRATHYILRRLRMTEHTFWKPDSWLSPLGKLIEETNKYSSDLSIMADSFKYDHITNLRLDYIEPLSTFSDQLNAGATAASFLVSRVEDFASTGAILTRPLPGTQDNLLLLGGDQFTKSTDSLLNSAASMAGIMRTTNIDILNPVPDLLTGITQPVSTHIPDTTFLLSNKLSELATLGSQLADNLSTFGSLIDTSIATTQLRTEILLHPISDAASYLADTEDSFSKLSAFASSIYTEYGVLDSVDTSSFLFHAPTVEPFAATQVDAVISGIEDSILSEWQVESAASLLDQLGDELYSRLKAIDIELADVYQEGIEAIESGHHGWIRHAGISYRTLLDHLLRRLAPNDSLETFLDDPKSELINGEYSRNSRLRYIFREVATGSYAKMAEQDIKLAEAIFFPSNEIIHKLDTPLSEHQMRVFWRRIQGSISVVLEAAGH